MSVQTNGEEKVPDSPFVLQTKRFACDRCHRQKLKCDRGPFVLSSGNVPPLGVCKRCERAGTECTNNSMTTPSSSTREKTIATVSSSDHTQSRLNDSLPNARSHISCSSSALEQITCFDGQEYNSAEPASIDQGLDRHAFDFDVEFSAGIDAESFDASSAVTCDDLLGNSCYGRSVDPSRTGDPTYYSVAGEPAVSGSSISGLFEASSRVSLPDNGGNWLTEKTQPMETPTSSDPMVEKMERLNELQTFIFNKFQRLSKDDILRAFLYPELGSYDGLGTSSDDGSIVGKLLHASACLTDILAPCGREVDLASENSPPYPSNENRSNIKRSYSNFLHDEALSQSTASAPGTSTFEQSSASALAPDVTLVRKNNTSPSPANGLSPMMSSSSTSIDIKAYSGLIVPARMTLLLCYVSLLSVYRSILAQALEILRVPPLQISNSTILGSRIQLEKLTHT